MSIVRMRPPQSTQVIGLLQMCFYLLENMPCDRMVEIGSYAGESTQIFSNFFREVIAIDPHLPNLEDKNNKEVIEQMKLVKDYFTSRLPYMPNVRHFPDSSADAWAKIPPDERFDFVYIDANHSYEHVRADILYWLPKVKPGGFIGGHDYQTLHPGVIKAVNEFLRAQQFSIEIPKLFVDSSWLIQKI